MPQQATINLLITRLHVTLQVKLRPSGVVNVTPYACREENLRLWTGIAKTQAVLAQTGLALNKAEEPYNVLCLLFRQGGWNVSLLEESWSPTGVE